MSLRNRLDQYLSIPLTFALFIAVPWASARLFAYLFRQYVQSAPLWCVLLLSVSWMIATLIAWAFLPTLPMGFFLHNREEIRARRTRMGLCPDCGYDLRESPLRCPECGAKNEISN